MKTRRLITGLVLALVLALVSTNGALADYTPSTNFFYGPVQINGGNIPVGTAVTAWCGGVLVITSPYYYDNDQFLADGITPNPDYQKTVYFFGIPSDNPGTPGIDGCTEGQTIIFKIGSLIADQIGIWHSMGNTRLPLSVLPTAAPVTISGDAGIGGATITYTGGSTTANSGGIYSFTVEAGWTGSVTPSMPGYTFNPVNRTYIHILDNQPNQDYTATLEVPAPPPLPASFYGTVKSSGENVPIGTQVSARINGVQYAVSPYTVFNGETVYSLNVPGDDPETPGIIEGGVPGDTIVFFVGSIQAAQTAIWQGGINVNLNLTATLPDYHYLFLPLTFR